MRLSKWDKQAIAASILNDVPKLSFEKIKNAIQEAIYANLCPQVAKLYKVRPDALKTAYINGSEVGADRSLTVIVGDMRDMDFRKILQPFKDAQEERNRVGRQLSAAIQSCSTLKQLNERLPEFKKYYPSPTETTKNLPALANVVSDLTKLGWTPGVKK